MRSAKRTLFGLPFLGALLSSLSLWGARPALAAPPAVNVQVEWRVVSSAQARARQAQIQVPGSVTLSTQDTRRQSDAVHSLTVLNGGKARLYVAQSVPQTSWQFLFSAPGQPAGQPGGGGATSPGGNTASLGGAQLLSQTVWIDLGQGLTVQPRWPGGKAQVEVQMEAVSRQPLGAGALLGTSGFSPEGAVQRREVMSTLLVPMGQWVVIAQSSQQGSQRTRGVLSTAELDDEDASQLEIRLTLP